MKKVEEELLAHPFFKKEIADEAMPGTIKKTEHFFRFLRKIVKCLKDELKKVLEPRIITPLYLLNKLLQEYYVD